MTSFTLFLTFVPLLAIILLAINFIFAPHNPYQEKDSTFECGFHSFLGQNRTQFSISFFIFALLFLLFDLEILLLYPYAVSAYDNSIYGLVIVVIFFLVLTLGFAFELGKNALKIDSKQLKQLISQIRLLEVAMSTRLTFWILCNVNKAALLAAAVAGVANFVATGDASGAESTAQAAEASSSAAEYAQWERDQLLRENPNGIVVTQTITEVVTQAIPGEAVTPTRETSVSSNGQQTTFTSTASGGVNTGNTVGSPAVPGEELGNETTTSGGDRNQQQ